MTKRVFDDIKTGLDQAIAFARGEAPASEYRVHGGARPIAEAPAAEDEPLMLFHPDRGWLSGVRFENSWRSNYDLDDVIDYPTHWLPMPPDPAD